MTSMLEQKIIDAVRREVPNLGETFVRKKDIWELKALLAERKAFLSRKKLFFRAAFRVDEAARSVRYSERLEESGSGFGAGDDFAGVGVRTWKTSSGKEGRTGDIKETLRLFGETYSFTFRCEAVREVVKRIAEEEGFSFDYRIGGV
ncbi:ribonucleoside-triphosphate reductase [Aminiphilus circumscriptus]|uniref:ribonucleoside-triphosphate reductase n=1 Tax=Aminiphilus circumscriptus TaxID=290732 RepID=UPI003B84A5C8